MYALHTVFENETFFAGKVVLARISSKNTGIQEYVFVRAMGNPNRNTTTQRRLLKIF